MMMSRAFLLGLALAAAEGLATKPSSPLLALRQALQIVPRPRLGARTLPEVHEVKETSEPARASFLSQWTFQWATPLLMLGNERPLTLDDVWPIPADSDAYNLSTTLARAYDFELERQAVSENKTVSDLACNTSSATRAITRALFRVHRGTLIRTGILRLINTLLQLGPPLLLTKFLGLLEAPAGAAAGTMGAAALRESHISALWTAGSVFGVLCLKTIVENKWFWGMSNLGLHVREGLSTAVYNKATRLGQLGQGGSTVGDIVNYMQLDAARLEGLAASIHTLWDGLLQIIVYISLLVRLLGPSVVVAIVGLFGLIPINAVAFKYLTKCRKKGLAFTDSRVRLVSEMLSGIRIIKMQAWEHFFSKFMANLRSSELSTIRSAAVIRAMLASGLSVAPALIFAATLVTYSSLGNRLTPAMVFGVLTLFNQLRFPLLFYPLALSSLADGRVALQRLGAFFASPEAIPYVERGPSQNFADPVAMNSTIDVEKGTGAAASGNHSQGLSQGQGQHSQHGGEYALGAVAMTAASFLWSAPNASEPSTLVPVLRNLNLRVSPGSLACIVGPVGSGKTAMLSAFLGNMHPEVGSGPVAVSGRMAYVAQSSWLPSGTIRKAITLGEEGKGGPDDDWYRVVWNACELSDLSRLPAGDETEIGEQGVTLSGGQKQRISLARALYSNPDVLFLDDPLSALDATVSAKVFHQVLSRKTGLMQNKTVVMVTNQLQWLPAADHIVVLSKHELQQQQQQQQQQTAGNASVASWEGSAAPVEETIPLQGSILDQGSYEDLVSRGQVFATLAEEMAVASPSNATRSNSAAHMSTHTASTTTKLDATGDIKASPFDGEKKLSETTTRTMESRESLSQVPGVGDVMCSDTSGPERHCLSEDDVECQVPGGLSPPPQHQDQKFASPEALSDIDQLEGQERTSGHGASSSAPAPAPEPGPALAPSPGQARDGPTPTTATAPTTGTATGKLKSAALLTEEQRQVGAVKWEFYKAYLTAGRTPMMLAMFVTAALMSQGAMVAQQLFLAAWSVDPDYQRRTLQTYVSGLVGLCSLIAACSYTRARLIVSIQLETGKAIHQRLSGTVLGAPVRFFDTTPVGRLLQRFSRDLDVIDSTLPGNLASVVTSALSVVGAMFTVLTVNPLTGVVLLPLTVVYFRVMNFFRAVARELKRLEGMSRAPIFSHFGETITGLSTLRAFGPSTLERWRVTAETKLDRNAASYRALKAMDRWLSVRLEIMGNTIVLATMLFSIRAVFGSFVPANALTDAAAAAAAAAVGAAASAVGAAGIVGGSPPAGTNIGVEAAAGAAGAARQTAAKAINTGLGGLAVTNALSVTGMLNWVVRCLASVESDMNAMERVMDTLTSTPSEVQDDDLADQRRKATEKEAADAQGAASGSSDPGAAAIDMSNGAEAVVTTTPAVVKEHTADIGSSGSSNHGSKTSTNSTSSTMAFDWNRNLFDATSPGAVERRSTEEDLRARDWPWAGAIAFRDVHLRYRPTTPLALRGVSFNVRAGERLGVVGRTGSGKSTLLVALLRLTDLESGSISLDGVDTTAVGSQALRRQLAILPQDPTLFSGTVRYNLDPGTEFTDQDIWSALEQVSMATTIAGLSGGLLAPVTEFGNNFSAGQRQLLCMARALLKRPRVLLLDEATATVDFETDALIQRTIRLAFKGCTVIVIAHRLSTILDSDRILVMDQGEVAELDRPETLLSSPTSRFYAMVKDEREQQ